MRHIFSYSHLSISNLVLIHTHIHAYSYICSLLTFAASIFVSTHHLYPAINFSYTIRYILPYKVIYHNLYISLYLYILSYMHTYICICFNCLSNCGIVHLTFNQILFFFASYIWFIYKKKKKNYYLLVSLSKCIRR